MSLSGTEKFALFGSANQQSLQAAALAGIEAARSTPGAVFAARMAGTDDPDRLGWATIEKVLSEQGALTFRMIPAAECARIERHLARLGCHIVWWDVFEGKRADVETACNAILQQTPAELRRLRAPECPTDRLISHVQEFMDACGVAPLPGWVLAGRAGPAALIILASSDGSIAATAFAYFPYNRFSPHRETAWGGLVCVRDELRGLGVGAYTNALMLIAAFGDLGSSRVHEFARAINLQSCRMIERCGLLRNERFRSGIAQPNGESLFTR